MENEKMIECTYSEDGKYKTFKSLGGYMIRKVGTYEIYEEATDIAESKYEYELTDKKIVNIED